MTTAGPGPIIAGVRPGPPTLVGACAVLAAVAAVAPAPVAAAPAADVVVVWSAQPRPALIGRLSDAARGRGAALVDRSPAATPPAEAAAALAAGIAAYDELRFDDASAALERAMTACDRSGADGLERDQLADLLLYRGLTHIQREETGAWDELVAAVRIDGARVLDPARFPPRAIEQLARARDLVAAGPRARLEVAAPAGCAVVIDGVTAADGAVAVAHGDHWVRAACPGHRPWGRRVTVDRDPVRIEATPAPIGPPGDDDALIQGRVSGARAVIELRLTGGVARLRRLAVDGRELDRVSLVLADDGTGDEAVVAALTSMLHEREVRARWYRSRWAWAAAGATAVAAVLVPILILDDRGTQPVVIRPDFPPL